MSNNSEVDFLVSRVRKQMQRDEQYAREVRQGNRGRQHSRLVELIIEAVQEYRGKVIPELVFRVREFFGV